MLHKRITIENSHLEPLEDAGKVSGFASPAEDYVQIRLNILEKLVQDPINTYYAIADTDDMIHHGISRGTIFICDTTVKPVDEALILVWYEQSWKVRQLHLIQGKQFFSTGSDQAELVEISKQIDVQIRGVITWSCRPHIKKPKSHVRTGRL